MAFKRFDKKLFDKNDELCKNKVKKLLKLAKYGVVNNPKRYGVDFLVYNKDKHVGYLEVERKIMWKSIDFPYKSVNFPYRKAKYLGLDKPTLFLMFNKDLDSYLTVTDKVMAKAPVNVVSNKYMKFGEEFFQVDVKKVVMNSLLKELKKMEKKNGK